MPAGFIDLPFRKQHPYLGVVLSYEKFEKLSLQARIKQKAGQISADSFLYSGPSTFHPSSDCSYGIPASFSTIRYGLASTGLPVGSDQLRQLVAKQVRLVLKSPSWITHEPTAELCRRYDFEDPVAQLAKVLASRRAKPSLDVGAFDTPERLRWHNLLPSFFVTLPATPDVPGSQEDPKVQPQTRLREVTGHQPYCPPHALHQVPQACSCQQGHNGRHHYR